jgi:hypothetical protein
MEEIWKSIPEFEGYYEASTLGRIRSIERVVKSGRGFRTVPSTILKPSLGQWGYEQVSLCMNNKHQTKRVNRLIALTFIPNPNNLPQVNHKDGVKTNNCVDNLEWCDGSYNMKHCFDNKLTDWGTKIRIIETNEEFNSIVECANKTGGHAQLIIACLNGRRKTHKGYHYEVIGQRISEKYNRNNHPVKNQVYDSKIKIEYNNEIRSLKEWSKILEIDFHTLETRYYNGDRGDRLFRKVRKYERHNK